MKEQVCGIDKGTYISQGINQLEELRRKIEESLEEVEFIINDMANNLPELRGMASRVEAYWFTAIRGMLRDSGSMVNMDETMSEIQQALTDYVNQQEHHPDECDCVECRARVEKGGLDYDPSNDDEEFEEHERQVFRDKGIDKD